MSRRTLYLHLDSYKLLDRKIEHPVDKNEVLSFAEFILLSKRKQGKLITKQMKTGVPAYRY